MRIEELSNLSLAPVSYENWKGYINGTTSIQSYWADTGYILAPSPYEDRRGYNRVNYVLN